ncbi:unnamed protein product [Chironomus riparius]|uniref:histone acetyltransferase n=1 Tax=Chironomus riparius TaxID=315576 RepID=A0A9N9S408_9DIPT|nr:unnamed protein product [Chironomus riparius]
METTFTDLIQDFHRQDTGRHSIFNPIVKDKIINYENVINLSKVEDNLNKGLYISNYWMFIEDVSKCFEFIFNNFISRMPIYVLAIDCKQQFDWKIDKFMKRRGYCCGFWHARKSKKIQCSGSRKCIVKPNAAYFRYGSWAFCEKCLRKFPSTGIKLGDNISVNKADFKFCFYTNEESEDFVSCTKCKKLFHERCVLHIKQSGIPFYCQRCRIGEPELKIINISSEQIAKTECDTYIENFLRQHKIPNCVNIVVRLVSNVPTTFTINPVIAKYQDKNYGHEISYNNCVIFVFLKLSDGTEICFFGIYFQLYGNSKCPVPNKNSVYLSYIDSVKLCIVKERTKIYQFILLGLFKYLKMKNFRRIFIWSCPPKRDVDYIFHEKPSDMKMPTKGRLGDWYKKLMKLAVDEHIAESFSGIKKFADDENWEDINNIPYIDSDMWPIRLEEAIIAAEKDATTDIMKKINELMEDQKIGFDKQYFVLHLSSNSTLIKAELPEVIKGKWINNRNDLVDMFWENKLEYSNERLAKFSTKVVLYRMFADDSICSICGKFSEDGVNLFLLCKSCVMGTWKQKNQLKETDCSISESFNSEDDAKIQQHSTCENITIIDEIIDADQSNITEIFDDIVMGEVFVDLTCEERCKKLSFGDFIDLTRDDSDYEIIEPVQYATIDLCN